MALIFFGRKILIFRLKSSIFWPTITFSQKLHTSMSLPLLLFLGRIPKNPYYLSKSQDFFYNPKSKKMSPSKILIFSLISRIFCPSPKNFNFQCHYLLIFFWENVRKPAIFKTCFWEKGIIFWENFS